MTDENLKQNFPSKTKFKNFIKKKALEIAQKYLQRKKEKHSKLDNLEFKKLKCAPYLKDPRISQKEAKLLFRLRTRMYHVKSNYKNKYINNLICDLCKSATCDQQHLMECSILKKEISQLKENTVIKYSDIFTNNDKIIPAIKLFSIICRRREELLDELRSNSNGL